jgi:hypothetical protein
MGSAHPTPQFQPFDPEAAKIMRLAFDTAWQSLIVSGSDLVASFWAEATREALAMRIIDMATLGERDVTRLRNDAVAYVLQAGRPKQEPKAGWTAPAKTTGSARAAS